MALLLQDGPGDTRRGVARHGIAKHGVVVAPLPAWTYGHDQHAPTHLLAVVCVCAFLPLRNLAELVTTPTCVDMAMTGTPLTSCNSRAFPQSESICSRLISTTSCVLRTRRGFAP
eukprot:scaffold79814_cov19-Tisochrysis_lutea.AAC.1